MCPTNQISSTEIDQNYVTSDLYLAAHLKLESEVAKTRLGVEWRGTRISSRDSGRVEFVFYIRNKKEIASFKTRHFYYSSKHPELGAIVNVAGFIRMVKELKKLVDETRRRQ